MLFFFLIECYIICILLYSLPLVVGGMNKLYYNYYFFFNTINCPISIIKVSESSFPMTEVTGCILNTWLFKIVYRQFYLSFVYELLRTLFFKFFKLVDKSYSVVGGYYDT